MVRGKIIVELSLETQPALQERILPVFLLGEDGRVRRIVVDAELQVVKGIAAPVFPDIAGSDVIAQLVFKEAVADRKTADHVDGILHLVEVQWAHGDIGGFGGIGRAMCFRG